MKIWSIVATNLVRTSRDKLGLFFIVLLPLILIVVLGMTYGGGAGARIGVVDLDGGPLASDLIASIRETPDVSLEIRTFATVEELRDASARGFVEFGLAIPADYDAALRSGGDTTVTYVAPATTKASAVRSTVDRAVTAQAALFRAARFVAARGVPFDQALEAARANEAKAPGVAVVTQSVAAASTTNGFGLGAQSQVILFMFLTSLTGAVELITTRQLGVSRADARDPHRAMDDHHRRGPGPGRRGHVPGVPHRRRVEPAVRRGLGRSTRDGGDRRGLLPGLPGEPRFSSGRSPPTPARLAPSAPGSGCCSVSWGGRWCRRRCSRTP